MQRYNPKDIEPKWQKIWDETGVYNADLNSSKPKYIAMSMFNYPSGNLHIGHAMNFTISDVKARFMRQKGFESYHPVGWDSFGLPAENRAIKEGMSPQASMAQLIPDYHKAYKAMGWSNDWSKEITTHTPEYYKWTQWIFAQMYKHGLAYQDARMQWWCDSCQTVLANEQVIDGKCWRHDGPEDPIVEKKEVKQWFFKITEYADELLEAIDDLDWTESVKLAQKNWIGKSTGAEVNFALCHSGLDPESSQKKNSLLLDSPIKLENDSVKVFTTRPDTLFGATFLVLAPEHELVSEITTDEQKATVTAYVKAAQTKTEVERQASKEKSGVFTGAYAVNPINGAKIPIWTADYVLMGYGTGAIMAVPAHDERDNEFAKKFDLPIVEVIMQYVELGGVNAPREAAETVEREAVDAIIKNDKDQYLLLVEEDNIHFVGGGVEAEDKNLVEAIKREVIEEVGYTDIVSCKAVAKIVALAYRIPKSKNQKSPCNFFEVTLGSDQKQASEAEDGKHSFKWVAKNDVAKLLSWEHHQLAWQQYLDESTCYHGEGVMMNSGEFDGQSSSDARENIVKTLASQGKATEKTNYKMRDWSVSRQRYWGAPIPVVNCPKDGIVLVPDEQLPVVLPELDDFKPAGDGRSALARATEWLNTTCPACGGPAERETDTLDTYICSSWYMLRYLDPTNANQIFSTEVANKWMPVDFYNGGDHATAHMLYARFVTRFFTKIGLLDNPEPFKQFLFNGKVTAGDGTMFSKSKGNGVDPLEIIGQGYGADALRTYLMFAAPLELWAKWDPQGVPGAYRFLNRLWNLVQEYNEAGNQEATPEQTKDLQRATSQMVKKITEDIQSNSYNTAIATAMGNVNTLYKVKDQGMGKNKAWKDALSAATACIAPFAPHTSEELWSQLGYQISVHHDSWPEWDDAALLTDTITVAVQINGKLRGEIQIAQNTSQPKVIAAAKANDKVAGYLDGQSIKKEIYVPGKIVNFVI